MTDPTISGPDEDRDEKQHELLKSRLSKVDLLETLPHEDLEWLSHRTPDVFVDQGQLFYTPRYTAPIIFLLLCGQMRLFQVLEGKELTLEVVEVGRTFGEASLAKEPQGLYAEALKPSCVGLLRLGVLEELVYRRAPQVGIKAMQLLSKQVLSYRSKLVDVSLKKVPGRLASLLLDMLEREGIVTSADYRIPTRYTHEQLATMIGAKRVAVSRAFGELRRAGVVQYSRRYIHIKDREALKWLAEAA